MKHIFGTSLVVLILLTSCEKKAESGNNSTTNPPAVPTVNPAGKWVSVSYYAENAWQSIPMPHHIEFRSDATFSFRDHNGINCTGQYLVSSPINTYTAINFSNGNCGLTTRFADMLIHDTLVLTVVSPPNITQNKVKYLREP